MKLSATGYGISNIAATETAVIYISPSGQPRAGAVTPGPKLPRGQTIALATTHEEVGDLHESESARYKSRLVTGEKKQTALRVSRLRITHLSAALPHDGELPMNHQVSKVKPPASDDAHTLLAAGTQR